MEARYGPTPRQLFRKRSETMKGDYKVFFTGGEGINWALDHDLIHLRRLTADFVQESSLEDCDIIHSVWWRGLLGIPADILRRKVVVASIADSPSTVLRTPEFAGLKDFVSAWLVEYSEAVDRFSRLRIPCLRFPDPIDLEQFHPAGDRRARRAAFVAKYGIPADSFLIGNFFRDSSMDNLDRPKKQKGADLFLELLVASMTRGVPVHVVLAGPRRHWIKSRLREHGVPFTYVGEETEADDLAVNTLDLNQIAELYQAIDLYVVPSRWEGAPNAVLEAAAGRTPLIGTPVGQIPDILDREAIFGGFDEGVDRIEKFWKEGFPNAVLDTAEQTVRRWNSDEALASRVRHIYETAGRMSRYSHRSKVYQRTRRVLDNRYTRVLRRWTRPRLPADQKDWCIALWHDFQPPPYGGGNQFMLALEKEFLRRGIQVRRNDGREAHAHILQGIWFDDAKLARERAEGSVVLHRVDGPIQLYRGPGHECDDDRCYELNRLYADSTIMQSVWSLERTAELGYRPIDPTVVRNAAEPDFFHRTSEGEPREPEGASRIRLISTAWSDNPRKGLDIYKAIDERLDTSRFQYTFVGRISEPLQNIEVVDPVDSGRLGEILRENDIYITASRRDPCSNALVEAMACGLPALYYGDGGHPELVSFGGTSFQNIEEFFQNLDRIANSLEHYRRLVWPNSMADVADQYLSILQNTVERK